MPWKQLLCAVPGLVFSEMRQWQFLDKSLGEYHTIQSDYRHTFFWEIHLNFQLQMQNRVARRVTAIIETDLWACQQSISHYIYRFS